MRLVRSAVLVLVGLVPAVADACSQPDCYRWAWLGPMRDSYPRDAAITLTGAPVREVCTDDFRKFASVVVHHGDQVVPGSFEVPVGLQRGLVWHPREPLAPGLYAMTIEIDNVAIDQHLGVPERPDVPEPCARDNLVQDLDFTVVDEASPTRVLPPGATARISTTTTI